MDKKTEKLLKKIGYDKLKAKHGQGNPRLEIPSLKTDNHRDRYPSGNGFAKATGKKQLHPDAKQFPVGFSHKSGLQLITQFDDLKYMSGKKF
jgi:hypothetical protein